MPVPDLIDNDMADLPVRYNTPEGQARNPMV